MPCWFQYRILISCDKLNYSHQIMSMVTQMELFQQRPRRKQCLEIEPRFTEIEFCKLWVRNAIHGLLRYMYIVHIVPSQLWDLTGFIQVPWLSQTVLQTAIPDCFQTAIPNSSSNGYPRLFFFVGEPELRLHTRILRIAQQLAQNKIYIRSFSGVVYVVNCLLSTILPSIR